MADIEKLRERYGIKAAWLIHTGRPHDPDVLALCNELETARARLAEASELLAELEWSDGWEYDYGEVIPFGFCPVCCRRRSDSHVSDCRLAKWLKKETP